mmetsp:Transcript_13433/g.33668  ORF Transcript_13433/g.33668 Transcript_13433/m.33668 type:complete len:444 (+) Transcript_13433:148-1479(+)
MLWTLGFVVAVALDLHGSIPYDYGKHGQEWDMGSCASREKQSPINLYTKLDEPPYASFLYNYRATSRPVSLKSDGKVLRLDLADEATGGVMHQDIVYALKEVRLHAQSEHTIRGQRFDGEVQLVHKRNDGKAGALLIISVFLTAVESPPLPNQAEEWEAADKDDVDFDNVMNVFLRKPFPKADQEVTIPFDGTSDDQTLPFNAEDWVRDGTFIQYAGSLTTPPCTENVEWFIRREPRSISTGQSKLLQDGIYQMTNFAGNWRAVMPLGTRETGMAVVKAAPADGATKPGQWPLPLGPNPRTDNEAFAVRHAEDARRKASQTAAYMRGFEDRLVRASTKHKDFMTMRLDAPMTTPAPGLGQTTTVPIEMLFGTTMNPWDEASRALKYKMSAVKQKVASDTIRRLNGLTYEWLLTAHPSVGGSAEPTGVPEMQAVAPGPAPQPMF